MKYLFLAVFPWLLTACQPAAETTHPQTRNLVEVVYASGNLYPQTEYKLFPNVTGYVSEIPVKEGDLLAPNALVARLSGPNRDAERENADRLLALTEKNRAPLLAQLKERLEAAEAKARLDSLTARRFEQLGKTGAVSEADIDKTRTAWIGSRQEFRALQRQYEAQQNSIGIDLSQSVNRAKQAGNNAADNLLKARGRSRVYELYKEVGDYVHQNEAIALLGDPDNPLARLSVDEADIMLLREGQKVLITFDAYGDSVFEARISKIYPKLNKAEQSVRVEATFLKPLPEAVYGLNLEANVLIREQKNVLSIPRTALLNGDSVVVKENGEKRKKKVKVGISDMQFVEIVSGLRPDDEILLNAE